MESPTPSKDELDETDRAHISEVFYSDMVPKLKQLDARLGWLNCEFAGAQYANWSIRFSSAGDDFIISEFEFDEDGRGMDLDL
jgi:hypothetical protein